MIIWDEIYSDSDYVYGTKPNDFLKENIQSLKPGKVLCLADGEGRNSVYLAKLGFEVTAVDSSTVGLEKGRRLAKDENVRVKFIHADLADYVIEPNHWDNIVSISCHLPSVLRKQVHSSVVNGLTSTGMLLLEAYTPKQLEYGTGGPPTADFMMTLQELNKELAGLEFLHELEVIREVIEGSKHTGTASVVQLIAKKL